MYFNCSEYSGDVDKLELGDMVEYCLSKGKGNKISAERVTKVHQGKNGYGLYMSYCLPTVTEFYIQS